jgi:RND family efflux transporter MFP subunit
VAVHQVAPVADLSTLKIDRTKPPRGTRWWRWLVLGCGLILLVGAAVFALRRSAPVVVLATAHRMSNGAGPGLLNASGYVTPRRRATIAAKITGLVSKVFVDEGMYVKQGQVLATLDNSDALVRLGSARASRSAVSAASVDLDVNLANAKTELYRTGQLEKEGVSSEQSLDLARTTAHSLQARIMLTQEQVLASDALIRIAGQDLDNTIVRAPFAGLVVSKDAQVGEMVSPISAGGGFTRTGIATIVDMTSLEVEVDVNESYISRVLPGRAVTVILDAYPDWKIPGTVRIIIPSADRQKATIKVRISFDKLDPRILADMGVKVTFLADVPKGQANHDAYLLVPAQAIRPEGSRQVVYVYRDGRTERRAVKLGQIAGDDQEVIAGLVEGDQVVVQGFDGLHDGTPVKVKQ